MTDIVERLRNALPIYGGAAADEIEALRAEVKRLKNLWQERETKKARRVFPEYTGPVLDSERWRIQDLIGKGFSPRYAVALFLRGRSAAAGEYKELLKIAVDYAHERDQTNTGETT